MDALEICVSRIIARLNQRIETCLHQCANTAAEDSLLTEEIGLGLDAIGRLQQTRSRTADCRAVCKSLLQCLARCILLHRNQHRNALAIQELAANRVTRCLRSDHRDIDELRRCDEAKVNVKAMCEHEHVALVEVRLDVLLVHIRLQLIVDQNHDDICPLCSLGIGLHRETLLLCLLSRLGALVKTHANINAGILQVQRMCMTLTTVTDNRNLMSL